MEISFYHLVSRDTSNVLINLLAKSAREDIRCFVRLPSEAMLQEIDNKLWAQKDPIIHGLASEEFAEHQPILLSCGAKNMNKAEYCFLLEDAQYKDLEDINIFKRLIILFNGTDSEKLEKARIAWEYFKPYYEMKYYSEKDNKVVLSNHVKPE